MYLIHTKYYGLLHGMDSFEYGSGDKICPLVDDDIFLEVLCCIDGLFDGSLDDFVSTRESQLIDIELDPFDLERSEKSVIDPLSKGVFIERLAKIIVGIHIIIAFWSCRESKMHSTTEIPENLCPISVLSRTASMTLIDDDEVEKIRIIAVVV